jgi:hypothetical protein
MISICAVARTAQNARRRYPVGFLLSNLLAPASVSPMIVPSATLSDKLQKAVSQKACPGRVYDHHEAKTDQRQKSAELYAAACPDACRAEGDCGECVESSTRLRPNALAR